MLNPDKRIANLLLILMLFVLGVLVTGLNTSGLFEGILLATGTYGLIMVVQTVESGRKITGWSAVTLYGLWAVWMITEVFITDGNPCEERAWMQNPARLQPCSQAIILLTSIAYRMFAVACIAALVAILNKYHAAAIEPTSAEAEVV